MNRNSAVTDTDKELHCRKNKRQKNRINALFVGGLKLGFNNIL